MKREHIAAQLVHQKLRVYLLCGNAFTDNSIGRADNDLSVKAYNNQQPWELARWFLRSLTLTREESGEETWENYTTWENSATWGSRCNFKIPSTLQNSRVNGISAKVGEWRTLLGVDWQPEGVIGFWRDMLKRSRVHGRKS